jgi:type II secretory pathway pseudopilin PulG
MLNVRQRHISESSRARGFSLVEVVIGAALILFAVVGLFGAYSFYLRVGLKQSDAISATFLAEEGAEAALLMRDQGWNNISSLTPGLQYFLAWDGSRWVATTTETTIDGIYMRTIYAGEVYRRNSDKDIVASTSPGEKTLDPGTRQITVLVNYEGGEKKIITYLANLFE